MEAVQNRIFLAYLSSKVYSHRDAVEAYRIFAASQVELCATSIKETIDAAVIFGDLFPAIDNLQLHPVVASLLRRLVTATGRFSAALEGLPEEDYLILGREWVLENCRSIIEVLEELKESQVAEELKDEASFFQKIEDNMRIPEGSRIATAICLAPLAGPLAPTLRSEYDNTGLYLNCAISKELPEEARQTLNEFAEAMNAAVSQKKSWQDTRSDVLELQMRTTPFESGPLSGTPIDGHDVQVKLGEDTTGKGAVFDSPLELVDDPQAHARLIEEARPLTQALRRLLYPHFKSEPYLERFRASGSLDPARLALGDFSEAVYRHYPVLEQMNHRGGALLVLACDGSASLDIDQISMLRLLTTAWLMSTVGSDVKVIAGIYHSDHLQGLYQPPPVVHWLFHPRKTPAIGQQDAVRALLSLDQGSGAQSDALQLMFILDEAVQVARGRKIYLVVLSDTNWNNSFHNSNLSGQQEVEAFFKDAYSRLGSRLNVTLVALAPNEQETGFEKKIDTVVSIPANEFDDPEAVARKIGVYVASQIRSGGSSRSEHHERSRS